MTEIEEEISVLESIFGSDMKELDPVWGKHRILITIRPHMSQSGNDIFADLEITFSERYPEVAPQVKITNVKGIPKDMVPSFNLKLTDKAAELAKPYAQPFVYDLTQMVDAFLVENFVQTTSLYDEFKRTQIAKNDKNAAEQRKKEEQLLHEEQALRSKIEKQMGNNSTTTTTPVKKIWQDVAKEHTMASIQSDGIEFDDWLTNNIGNSKSRFLADFEVVSVLGSGGFGKVIKARNRLDGNYYAIKRVRLKRQDVSMNRKIRREVTSLATMFHPHIVRYYQAWVEDMNPDDKFDSDSDEYSDEDESTASSNDLEEDHSGNDNPLSNSLEFEGWGDSSDEGSVGWSHESPQNDLVMFIQMEYCSGQTLREIIDQGILIGNNELVWKFFRQILEALYYVHDTCHFIHRDLKPANVFLDSNHNVKLGDFGLAVTATSKKDLEEDAQLAAHASSKKSKDLRAENTSGVGTTLYRAPEVTKGKYNEKCDMFSLGILLFEMLVPPFGTMMERMRTLNDLRSKQGDIEMIKDMKPETQEIIKWLLHKNPKKRPTAIKVLESGKMPRKIEIEESYFEEVMRVVKSADRFSPLYVNLLDTLFQSPTYSELFYTYDKDLLQYNNLSKSEKRHEDMSHKRFCVFQEQICDQMADEFHLFGAIRYSTPLLVPASTMPSDLHTPRMMDKHGTICELPINLTRPFARWIALRRNTMTKRFDFSNVYLTTEIGGQPKAKLQGTLDSVIPVRALENPNFMHAWHADHIICSVRALTKQIITDRTCIVFFQDFVLQQRALTRCGIEIAKHNEVRELLDNYFSEQSTQLNWSKIRTQLTKVVSQKQADSLRPYIMTNDPLKDLISAFGDKTETQLLTYLASLEQIRCVFRPWLTPVVDMETSLFFALAVKSHQPSVASKASTTQNRRSVCTNLSSNNTTSSWYVAATGGRYCNLVKTYQISSLSSSPVAALGTRFHVERIVQAEMQFRDESRGVMVLVVAPSDEEPVLLSACAELCERFRQHNIAADWVHPHISTPTMGETFVEYCKAASIPFLVNRRKGTLFRVRAVKLLIDKEFQRFEQVLQFVESKINSG